MQTKKNSFLFEKKIKLRNCPLLHYKIAPPQEKNPFYTLFSCLSDAENFSSLENKMQAEILKEANHLTSHLYILSLTAGLAPLLGLLGTVWGILGTFSNMHSGTGALSNNSMLSGLSLALTTTVLGLLVAIPALIAFNFLKNFVLSFEADMEYFSHSLLLQLDKERKNHAL